MTRNESTVRILVGLVLGFLFLWWIASPGEAAPRALTLEGVRNDFNVAADRVRVLAIMSPG